MPRAFGMAEGAALFRPTLTAMAEVKPKRAPPLARSSCPDLFHPLERFTLGVERAGRPMGKLAIALGDRCASRVAMNGQAAVVSVISLGELEHVSAHRRLSGDV